MAWKCILEWSTTFACNCEHSQTEYKDLYMWKAAGLMQFFVGVIN